jgi:hypothetical protein
MESRAGVKNQELINDSRVRVNSRELSKDKSGLRSR